MTLVLVGGFGFLAWFAWAWRVNEKRLMDGMDAELERIDRERDL